MPLIDFEDKATRRELYKISMGGTWNPATKREAKLGMCRATYFTARSEAALLASYYIALGVLPSDTFAVVGAGWGYSIEYLNRVHRYNGVGIDTSLYVQSTKDQDDSAEIAEWLAEAGWTMFDPEWVSALNYFGSGGSRLKDETDIRRCRVTILNEEVEDIADNSAAGEVSCSIVRRSDGTVVVIYNGDEDAVHSGTAPKGLIILIGCRLP